MRTKSMRGEHVDFARYLNEEGEKIALGNAMLNARGDQIDTHGNVVRTRADISAEYHRKNEKSVRQVSVKAIEDEFVNPAVAVAALRDQARAAGLLPPKAGTLAAEDQTAEMTQASKVKARKVIESE